jgi:hypothetical protein
MSGSHGQLVSVQYQLCWGHVQCFTHHMHQLHEDKAPYIQCRCMMHSCAAIDVVCAPWQPNEEQAATRWRVRRPAWLLVERVALDAQWRDSQRAYRPWASTGRTAPGFNDVPAPVKVRGYIIPSPESACNQANHWALHVEKHAQLDEAVRSVE